MAIQTALWKVGDKPTRLVASSLASENLLEEMICASPELLYDEWMIIGKQVQTRFGGRVDLVGIAPDGSLVLIELKRDKTPRDVVAQALDYAGWLETLTSDEIASMYAAYRPEANLAHDFRAKFGSELSDEEINQSHQIVVVASQLDDSTERIINYLLSRDVPINVLFFQVFSLSNDQILSRSWLVDPVKAQVSVAAATDENPEPWNGEYYGSFGEDKERSWQDATEFGFFSAGGGLWYTRTLSYLKAGDRVWVKIPGLGFVGVGEVTGGPRPASQFMVPTPDGPQPITTASKRASYLSKWDGTDKQEVVVPVRWLQTVPIANAVNEVGLFGNQNTVCQPRATKWRSTVERLKAAFPNHSIRPTP